MAGLREALAAGAGKGPTKPPHLRAATGAARCATCMYWKQKSLDRGTCRLYGAYPTGAGQVCDAYKGA